MAVPIIELADDIVAKLNTATGLSFERRITPYSTREAVKDGRWFVFIAGEETTRKAREVDSEVHTVDIAYQQTLPESTDNYVDPIDNLPWMDERLQMVENVKALFRVDGSLRNEDYLGLRFSSMTNAPLILPELLVDYGIFAAVVRLEFTGERSPADD